MVSQASKVHNSASFLFCCCCCCFWLILGLVVWPRSVCISKSQRSLCTSFSRTDSRLCIYHLFIWSNFNFSLNSQWNTLRTHYYYSFFYGASLRLADKFTYLGSSVSSTENDIDTRQTKAWTAIGRLSIIWKSDLTDEMKRSFFQAAVVSILLYGCTTWTLTKRLEKKLDGNYTRMLRAILNKSWRQHPTRRQLYGHLPPITKTIQVRRARHAGHCWRSKDELVSDVLLWTPTYGQAKAGRPARTYIQQLCEDTACNPEDDREKWREMVKDIRAGGTSWWWWWLLFAL